jgi:hypothetical protein
VGVEPDHAETVVSCGEALDRADVRTAAAAEYERARRQVGCDRERLRGERLLVDDRGLRIVERQRRGLDHLFAPVAPRARDADEAGRERATARMALVLGAESDRCVRAARRALRAQQAQAIAFSKARPHFSTCIPARS